MKKYFLIACFFLFYLLTGAQNYKPLEKVEVPDFPTNKINVEQKEYLGGGTYYTASHRLVSRRMDAELGVPPAFCMWVENENTNITEYCTAKLSVGGEEYFLIVDFTSTKGKSLSIPLKGQHIKHIAVSGLQSITYLKNGDLIQTKDFNLIEQELWRRNAEALIGAVEKYNIL